MPRSKVSRDRWCQFVGHASNCTIGVGYDADRLAGPVSPPRSRRFGVARLPRHGGRLLDLGCDDGDWTMKLASVTPREGVHGVEVVEERAVAARSRGVDVVVADLAHVLPLPADTFDVIHANQVIEHVPDIDLFATEVRRLLKPGGLAIVSTENTSSWHNVFAAFCGWQMFSSTNLSGVRLGIGNPLAVHRGESDHVKTWTHKVLFSARGLRDLVVGHAITADGWSKWWSAARAAQRRC